MKTHLRLSAYSEDLRAALDYLHDGHTQDAKDIIGKMLRAICHEDGHTWTKGILACRCTRCDLEISRYEAKYITEDTP